MYFDTASMGIGEFYKRNAYNGIRDAQYKKIYNHELKMSMWDVPNNEEQWCIFLTYSLEIS